jgi:hypothetical protein
VAIRLRTYRGPEDLDVQNAFWVQVTRDLPWCWKPTTSPTLFAKGPQFDPRSRCFAFDGDRLVGYMSFTGHGDFVSLGYPWVLPGYEGELQERLYDEVYGFAAGPEHGGKTFAQRFRQQWIAQISFFERHGFAEQRNDPIYALDLRGASAPELSEPVTSLHHDLPKLVPVANRYAVEIQQQFEWEEFCKLAAKLLPKEQLAMFKLYFQTVDFDLVVKATKQGGLAVYLGITIRSDTGFAELIAVALEPAAADTLGPCLVSAVQELQLRNALFLGTKPIPAEGASETITQMGFKKVSEELLLSKKI